MVSHIQLPLKYHRLFRSSKKHRYELFKFTAIFFCSSVSNLSYVKGIGLQWRDAIATLQSMYMMAFFVQCRCGYWMDSHFSQEWSRQRVWLLDRCLRSWILSYSIKVLFFIELRNLLLNEELSYRGFNQHIFKISKQKMVQSDCIEVS